MYPRCWSEAGRKDRCSVTYRDELENFIYDNNRCTEIEYSLPFSPVQWRDGEQLLNKGIRTKELVNIESTHREEGDVKNHEM